MVCRAEGFVFACAGIITLNLRHTDQNNGNYETHNLRLNETLVVEFVKRCECTSTDDARQDDIRVPQTVNFQVSMSSLFTNLQAFNQVKKRS